MIETHQGQQVQDRDDILSTKHLTTIQLVQPIINGNLTMFGYVRVHAPQQNTDTLICSCQNCLRKENMFRCGHTIHDSEQDLELKEIHNFKYAV